MSFKTLEQRYTEKVKDLYKGATSKFENGKPSRGRNDDPLIVRQPGKGYWNFAEGRMTPLRSSFEDVKRLTLFSVSVRGIRFLAKQQLLQTGNTFEQTRLLNPAFTIGNAVPFLHIKRNLRPLRNLFGKTNTEYSNVKTLGQLQKATYDSFDSKGIGGFLKKLLAPIDGVRSAITAKKNVGEIFTWEESRPELKKDKYIVDKWLYSNSVVARFIHGGEIRPGLNGTREPFKGQKYKPTEPFYIAKNQLTSIDYKSFSAPITPITPPTNDILRQSLINTEIASTLKDRTYSQEKILLENQHIYTQGQETKQFIKYFNASDEFSGGSVNQERNSTTESGSESRNARDIAYSRTSLRYVKDPINLEQKDVNSNLDLPYNKLKSTENINDPDDPIVVSIAMGKNSPVQFRAFIKDLQQTATPEYKTYQYIGRMEKFINYLGVQREITFKLGIVAFSADELDVVWKKINYLTGLVYPYGYNRGIMQPNIAKLTIGKVFLDQPGYFTSLNFNFNQLAESWDIRPDKKVPIGAEVDMRFTLIEKHSKTALSPFYGITEKMKEFPTPPVTAQTEEKEAPTNQPQNVPVEERTSSNTNNQNNQNLPANVVNQQIQNATGASRNLPANVLDRRIRDAIEAQNRRGLRTKVIPPPPR